MVLDEGYYGVILLFGLMFMSVALLSTRFLPPRSKELPDGEVALTLDLVLVNCELTN